MQSIGKPTNHEQQGDADVMGYLLGLLEQLEGAQGQPDTEARRKLELLKAQLQIMEAAQQGKQVEVPPTLQTEVAVAQELDSLDNRLTSLEQRLDGLDPDALQVVQQSVVGWVGGAEMPDPGSETGGSSQPGAS